MRLILLVLIVVFGLAASSEAADGYEEMVLGSPDAPVTIVEYSSLTCPHCATFHRDTLPKIKKDYIDSGKVRLIFNDFPFERVGYTAAIVVRCAPKESRFAMLDMLFTTQTAWAGQKNPIAGLYEAAQLGGLSKETIDACLQNQDVQDGILERLKEGRDKLAIESTPTFFVNGTRIVGAQPYEDFKRAIDGALAAAGAR